MTKTAFAGVKVLELAELVSGPYCTKLLADLGADVIKIERPPHGDIARRKEPFLNDFPHPERSGLFFYLNTNKRGITLNLESATGREVFKKLVQDTDILIEDNPPSVMAGLGLDYESLSPLNPGLIMTSITPFGQSGPYRDYKAYHLNSYGASGLAQILINIMPDEMDKRPLKGPGYLGEYDAGLSAAVATVGALYSRLATGTGQHIDISKQESLIALERVEIGRHGNDSSIFSTVMLRGMVGGLQRCKDGWVVFTLPMEHQWQAMVKLLGSPDWVTDERFQDETVRAQYAPELNQRIGEWTITFTKEELFHKAQSMNCPVGMVTTVEDLLNSEQLKTRDFFVEVEHAEMGRVTMPAAPYRYSETPWRVERTAPLLGEHNSDIYCHRLSYSGDDLVKMRQAGVI